MIKGVLLDLDNTLLHNPDGIFSQSYKERFERHFLEKFGIEGASNALRRGIILASRAADGQLTNAALILRCLAEGTRLPIEAIDEALESFYDRPYKQLRALTAPMMGAETLVAALLAANLRVAIATNPIYPERAIRQRLAWAGLSPFVSSFAHVTHSENTHFAKPQPAYYAEVVARVGVEPDECLVIGDSLTNDIAPAKALGMHSWQVAAEGGLQPILERLRKPNWQNELSTEGINPVMLEPQFRGNLAALAGLLDEVGPHQWLQRPDPEEWSILQILCHLWSAETEVHQRRLQIILAENNPFIPALPPPGPDIAACHDDGMEVFERFRAERQRTMKTLAGLTEADWLRRARHSIFGLTNLLEMAYFTAQHDRLHITQLCQTLGKCLD